MLAAYSACRPSAVTGAPAPVKPQLAGRSVKAAGAETGSSAQRVSTTVPTASVAATAAFTGVLYQPADPFGAGGVSVTVVSGGALSTNAVQLYAVGVTMIDH